MVRLYSLPGRIASKPVTVNETRLSLLDRDTLKVGERSSFIELAISKNSRVYVSTLNSAQGEGDYEYSQDIERAYSAQGALTSNTN